MKTLNGYSSHRWTFLLLILLVSCQMFAQPSLLHKAASEGDVITLKSILKKGAEINATDTLIQTPLMVAAKEGQIKAVKLLLKKGAKTNLQNYFGETALMLAIQQNHVQVVKLLLKKRADLNLTDRKGWTALMLSKSSEVTALLLAKDMVQAKEAKVNYATPTGLTPLMVAAEEGNAAIVKLLIAAGAKKEMTNASGQKAIDLAKAKGHQEIENILQ